MAGTTCGDWSCAPVARQQQQRARQPLLARVAELIDQVFFDPDLPRQRVRDEPIRHRMLLVQHPLHCFLGDEQDHARRHRGGAAHPDRLAGQTALAEEVSGLQHAHDRFSPGLRHHRQFDGARLDVQDTRAGVALLEDGRARCVLRNRLCHSRRIRKRLVTERLDGSRRSPRGARGLHRGRSWHTPGSWACAQADSHRRAEAVSRPFVGGAYGLLISTPSFRSFSKRSGPRLFSAQTYSCRRVPSLNIRVECIVQGFVRTLGSSMVTS